MREPPDENGFPRERPLLPTGLVAAAVIVALLAVSGLIFLLYRETRGPGEILRRFARAVDEGDCEGSYDLLDGTVRAVVEASAWCRDLPSVDDKIDADFDLQQAVLRGDEAEVHVSGVPATEWRLRRFGERTWRVVGPEGGFSMR
jgi:hypothetical protein